MIFLFGTLLILVLEGTSARFMEQSAEVMGDFLRKSPTLPTTVLGSI